MNRRGFLRALAAAPVAALMAPAALAKAPLASGGLIYGSAARWGVVGEIGPESILPFPRFSYPVTSYVASGADFLSQPAEDIDVDYVYVREIGTGALRDLYLANSAI